MADNKPSLDSTEGPNPTLPPDESSDLGTHASPVEAVQDSAALDNYPNAVLEAPEAGPARTTLRDSPLHDILVGPHGLYPGSRWLIYLAMCFIVFQTEVWLLAAVRTHLDDLWWRLITEAGMMIAAILPGFVMARIEERPFGNFGLPARRAFGRNFWVGTLWGIVSLSILIFALRLAGAFDFGSLAIHGTRIWKFALYYALLFLLTGFFEDFLLRGYSQWVLSRGMNFWPAAALLSAIFGAIHGSNPGEGKTGLVAAGLIGLFLCLTLRRTGDLWWAIGFHMAWDWGESFFYSVPDSGMLLRGHLINSTLHGPDWLTGGSVGPEGSYLIFVLIGGLWVLFDRIYPEVKYEVTVTPKQFSNWR